MVIRSGYPLIASYSQLYQIMSKTLEKDVEISSTSSHQILLRMISYNLLQCTKASVSEEWEFSNKLPSVKAGWCTGASTQILRQAM